MARDVVGNEDLEGRRNGEADALALQFNGRDAPARATLALQERGRATNVLPRSGRATPPFNNSPETPRPFMGLAVCSDAPAPAPLKVLVETAHRPKSMVMAEMTHSPETPAVEIWPGLDTAHCQLPTSPKSKEQSPTMYICVPDPFCDPNPVCNPDLLCARCG